ncbi:hypothetical protein ACH4D5_16400 [Streptomyces sp. NPDC018029]|uniref:hypothetical protein n=1 Tax=Streptomyces sp. NPDC018029 TaxID=3365032 RepID=UPI0037AE02A6
MTPLRSTSRISTVTATAAATLVLVLAAPATATAATHPVQHTHAVQHPPHVTAEDEHPEAGPLALASAAVVGAAAGVGVWLLRRRARDTDDS